MEKRMNYEEFKNKVMEGFKKYLPEDLQSMELRIKKCKKNNGVAYDGLTMIGGNKVGESVLPLLYLDNMYEYFLADVKICEDEERALDAMFKYFTNLYVSAMQERPENVLDLKKESAKKRIVYTLVNTQKNREILDDIPHREFLDFSIVYRWVVDMYSEGLQSFVLTNAVLDRLGLTESDLFAMATETTKKILSPKIIHMNEMLGEMFAIGGVIPEDEEVEDKLRENGQF